MKVLLCHTFYQQQGGEDVSFAAEADLLERCGHEVIRYTRHNDALSGMSRIGAAWRTFWNGAVYREVRRLIRERRPEVMHCTNTFPLLSPAIYYAARAERVPVVQSLRNYRLMCPSAVFLRDGKVCESCLGKGLAWPGVIHRCYRGSLAGSAVVAGMLAWHRLIGTWRNAVDLYFTPSAFARGKYIEAGFDPARVAVKPNFIDPDPRPGQGDGGYAILVGRLAEGKGIDTVLAAWARCPEAPPLWFVGDGPLADTVRAAAAADSRIRLLGHRRHAEVLELVGAAAFLVMSSTWYETFGRTIIEAFARGTPVLASRLGAMAELVEDGRTGLLFTPGDAADLAASVRRISTDRGIVAPMRAEARRVYLEKYTADRNLPQLLALYERAQTLHAARTVLPRRRGLIS
ncbi:MAG: glycosyltransferase [Gemmataceae bacterium]